MRIKLFLPELEEIGLYSPRGTLDTAEDFVIGCRHCVGETPQGFHFRPTFRCFELSGKDEDKGTVYCANPACGQHLSFIIRKI
ncbi:MAG: hypothetical protein J6I40_06990 [Mailhella sp.]|nr:hypothetical protein [Mailhella sp.]